MTDLTVIEGGGTPGNPNSEMAEAAFRRFVASLIRAIAGKQSVPELHAQLEDFVEFTDHANLSEVDVMQAALVTLTAQAFAAESDSLGQLSLDRVTRAALLFVAESFATDSAAHARRGKREHDLRNAIEQATLSRERRSRENGWSYLTKLHDDLDK